MLYAFFWVIPRRLNFECRRFGTLCSVFIGRWLYEEWIRFGNVGVLYEEGFGSKLALPLGRWGGPGRGGVRVPSRTLSRCIVLDIYWNIITMHGPMDVKKKYESFNSTAFNVFIDDCVICECKKTNIFRASVSFVGQTVGYNSGSFSDPPI